MSSITYSVDSRYPTCEAVLTGTNIPSAGPFIPFISLVGPIHGLLWGLHWRLT